MPLFEYRCDSCDTTFEKLLKQPEKSIPCPECDKEIKRKVSVFAASGDSCNAPSGSGFG